MGSTRCLLPVFVAISIFTFNAFADQGVWSDESTLTIQSKAAAPQLNKYRYLRADMSKLKALMNVAPMERSVGAIAYIDLPMPDGEIQTLLIEESPVMAPELQASYPDFKTYRVRSTGDVMITGRVDLVETGFHGYLNTGKGTVVINPDPTTAGRYLSFYKQDFQIGDRQFSCGVKTEPEQQLQSLAGRQSRTASRVSDELLTYRIAVGTTFEYGQAVTGGSGVVVTISAEITTAINRVNTLFERDFGVTLQIVANNNNLISVTQGELSNNDGLALLAQTQAFIESNGFTNADYDVGHIFSTGGGGVAGLGVVCNDTATQVLLHKSQGVTGLPNPTGDAYYVDFVAHELGHQFGANHTFNGTTLNCGSGNRNAATAFEPGSGSTIMAYAGICGSEDIQMTAISGTTTGVSEDTFHAGSIQEVVAFTRNGGGRVCDVATATGTNAPTANAGGDFIIPGQTPFQLTGSATDGDTASNLLSYQWDEMDAGTATDSATFGTDLGDNALFRSFAANVNNAVRTLPRQVTILSGVEDKAERLPSLSRDMNFRLTVRDNTGNVDEDDMQISVDQNAGPFSLFTASTAVTLDLSKDQVIEWNVACTDGTSGSTVNCSDVVVSISTNNGATFTELALDSSVNDGEATIPAASFAGIATSTTAVLKIACMNNIFFDLSDALITLQQGTGSALVSTGVGGNTSCGTAGTASTGGGILTTIPAVSTFDVSNATTVDLSNVITGSVNDIFIQQEVFEFTGTDEIYTIVLSDYGSSDLDMHLTDSDGVVLVQSISVDITETIKVALTEGRQYFLVVTAFDTGGATQSYSITTTRSAKPVSGSDDDKTLSFNPWFLLVLVAYRLSFYRRKANQLIV